VRSISKNIFLNTLACPTLGWLLRSEAEETRREPTLAEHFHMEEGRSVHQRAHELFPEGLIIKSPPVDSAVKATFEAIGNPAVSEILEGVFSVGPYVTKPDVLVRKGDGWQLIEVKASLDDKAEFIDDMAYTAMVLRKAGLPIIEATLVLMSRDFRLGMPAQALFIARGHTQEVLIRSAEFEKMWSYVAELTGSTTKPEPDLRLICKKCPLLHKCVGKGVTNHIFDLPRLRKKRFNALQDEGIISIEDIPNDFPLTDNQMRVLTGVRTGNLNVFGDLKGELAAVTWPAHYLDFETMSTALPLYPNVAPYEQLPVIFSVHVCSEPGRVVDHHQFIADPDKDSRRDLAQHLVEALGEKGSIVVYSSFEKRKIKYLASLFPDLYTILSSNIDRLYDLERTIRRNLYHPGFHGRTSIKATLPALVPELSYEGLRFQEGGDAMAAFAYLALGQYTELGEADSVKRDLLRYCSQDTLAMVSLHKRLADLAVA